MQGACKHTRLTIWMHYLIELVGTGCQRKKLCCMLCLRCLPWDSGRSAPNAACMLHGRAEAGAEMIGRL